MSEQRPRLSSARPSVVHTRSRLLVAAVVLAVSGCRQAKRLPACDTGASGVDASAAEAPAPRFRTSFDCDKASAEVEKRICTTEQWAELDVVLGEVYDARTRTTAGDAKARLRGEQRVWIAKRDACIGLLPTDEDVCMMQAYRSRILELGGADALAAFHRRECDTDARCFAYGQLALERGRWAEAARAFEPACVADHDGDQGWSCTKRAFALDKVGQRAEALALVTKSCDERHNNEACAAAYRWRGVKSANPWVGLYRSEQGTLFVAEREASQVSVHGDIHGANGHQCFWDAGGAVEGGRLIVRPDPNEPACTPKIERRGETIVVDDPEGACQRAYCAPRAMYAGEFRADRVGGILRN